MNIRDLEYFLAVAKFRHFGQAAKHCYVSQPTLSGQIKKLEEELGVTLFERSNRTVMLTEAGEKISYLAKRILSDTDEIFDIANSYKHPLEGRFRLGGIPTLAPYLFPDVVSEIRQRMPELKLILIEEKTRNLIDLLQKGEIDAGLVSLPVDQDFLDSLELFEDEFYLAVPTAHELASLDEVEMDRLENMNLLLLEEGHCLRGQALQACNTVAVGEHNYMATSLETLRLMVKAGTGITIMPKVAIREDETDIQYLPFRSPSPSRMIGLIWRKTTVRKPIVEELSRCFGCGKR